MKINPIPADTFTVGSLLRLTDRSASETIVQARDVTTDPDTGHITSIVGMDGYTYDLTRQHRLDSVLQVAYYGRPVTPGRYTLLAPLADGGQWTHILTVNADGTVRGEARPGRHRKVKGLTGMVLSEEQAAEIFDDLLADGFFLYERPEGV